MTNTTNAYPVLKGPVYFDFFFLAADSITFHV